MAALTGNSVGSSYLGLIKTTDNAALDLADRAITDGAGNVTPLNLSTQAVKVEGAGKAFEINDANFQVNTDNTVIASADGTSQGFAVTGTATTFGGNVDFTAATVTGITDTDTTYTLDTAQSGSDATITLTGSDASTDTITLAAGTNITLTEAGDTITIDAAGGGGGGGTLHNKVPGAHTFATGGFFESFRYPQSVIDRTSLTSRTYFSFGSAAPMEIIPTTKFKVGETIDEFAFKVNTAFASFDGFMVALYDSVLDTNGEVQVGDRLTIFTQNATLLSTTGTKIISGLNYTVPATTSGTGIYFVAIWVANSGATGDQLVLQGVNPPKDFVSVWPGQTFMFLDYGFVSTSSYSTLPPATGVALKADSQSANLLTLFR